jgi:hypothetical protein
MVLPHPYTAPLVLFSLENYAMAGSTPRFLSEFPTILPDGASLKSAVDTDGMLGPGS